MKQNNTIENIQLDFQMSNTRRRLNINNIFRNSKYRHIHFKKNKNFFSKLLSEKKTGFFHLIIKLHRGHSTRKLLLFAQLSLLMLLKIYHPVEYVPSYMDISQHNQHKQN